MSTKSKNAADHATQVFVVVTSRHFTRLRREVSQLRILQDERARNNQKRSLNVAWWNIVSFKSPPLLKEAPPLTKPLTQALSSAMITGIGSAPDSKDGSDNPG